MSSPAAPVPTLETCAESIAFLFGEMQILAGLCFSNLEILMGELASGRSPQALDLASRIQDIQIPLDSFQEVVRETDLALDQFEKIAQGIGIPSEGKLSDTMTGWEQEYQTWQEWLSQVTALIKKMHLIASQNQLTPLGRLPLEDLWEEIGALAKK